MVGQQSNDDRVELEGIRCATVLDGVVDDSVQQELAAALRVVLGLSGFQCVFQLREFHLRDGDDDLVLGLELMVDRALCHSDRVSDHLIRRGANAMLGEQVQAAAFSVRICGALRDVDPRRAVG